MLVLSLVQDDFGYSCNSTLEYFILIKTIFNTPNIFFFALGPISLLKNVLFELKIYSIAFSRNELSIQLCNMFYVDKATQQIMPAVSVVAAVLNSSSVRPSFLVYAVVASVAVVPISMYARRIVYTHCLSFFYSHHRKRAIYSLATRNVILTKHPRKIACFLTNRKAVVVVSYSRIRKIIPGHQGKHQKLHIYIERPRYTDTHVHVVPRFISGRYALHTINNVGRFMPILSAIATNIIVFILGRITANKGQKILKKKFSFFIFTQFRDKFLSLFGRYKVKYKSVTFKQLKRM